MRNHASAGISSSAATESSCPRRWKAKAHNTIANMAYPNATWGSAAQPTSEAWISPIQLSTAPTAAAIAEA